MASPSYYVASPPNQLCDTILPTEQGGQRWPNSEVESTVARFLLDALTCIISTKPTSHCRSTRNHQHRPFLLTLILLSPTKVRLPSLYQQTSSQCKWAYHVPLYKVATPTSFPSAPRISIKSPMETLAQPGAPNASAVSQAQKPISMTVLPNPCLSQDSLLCSIPSIL